LILFLNDLPSTPSLQDTKSGEPFDYAHIQLEASTTFIEKHKNSIFVNGEGNRLILDAETVGRQPKKFPNEIPFKVVGGEEGGNVVNPEDFYLCKGGFTAIDGADLDKVLPMEPKRAEAFTVRLIPTLTYQIKRLKSVTSNRLTIFAAAFALRSRLR